MSRYTLPTQWTVRYDYHTQPHGVSAIVFDSWGEIRGVGFAKHNPTDMFRFDTGRSIALGRALAGRAMPIAPTRPARPTPKQLGASLADELLA